MASLLAALAVFAWAALGGFARPAAAPMTAPPAGQTNVVFVIADDLSAVTNGLGGYAAPELMPNLHRLMRRGVTFTNAHANNPICGPSRASLLTGLYPHTTGFYTQQPNFREVPRLREARTFMEHFTAHGYDVYGTGKIFHNGHEDPEVWRRPDGFDGWGVDPDFGPWPWRDSTWQHPHPDLPAHYARNAFQNFAPLSAVPDSGGYEGWRLWDGTPFRYESAADRDPMPDERSAAFAADVLGQSHERPFLLAVGFNRPHLPLYVPEEYFARFPLEELELPAYFARDTSDVARALIDNPYEPGWQESSFIERFERLREAFGPDPEAGWRRYLQAYLAGAAFVDDQLGKVLDALDAGPHAENTLVVFTSDHGYHIGEKSWLFKWTLWEPATHVPLVAAGPGVAEGAAVAHPVSLIDLYPTFTDYAGLPPDPNAEANGLPLDGFSLRPLLENPKDGKWGGPDVALSTIRGVPASGAARYEPGAPEDQHFAVRSARYRYVLASTGEEELYAHRHDPNEWTNLARDPAYADVQARLRAALLQMTGQAEQAAAPSSGSKGE